MMNALKRLKITVEHLTKLKVRLKELEIRKFSLMGKLNIKINLEDCWLEDKSGYLYIRCRHGNRTRSIYVRKEFQHDVISLFDIIKEIKSIKSEIRRIERKLERINRILG